MVYTKFRAMVKIYYVDKAHMYCPRMVQGHHLESGAQGSDDPYHIYDKWSSQSAVVLLYTSSTALTSGM